MKSNTVRRASNPKIGAPGWSVACSGRLSRTLAAGGWLLCTIVAGCGGGGGGGGSTTPPGQTGRATGLVKQRANGQPVAGATVTFGTRQGTTNGQGQYSVDAIPVGTAQYAVAAGGFATLTTTLTTAIATGDNAIPDALLQPSLSDTAPGVPYSIQGRVTLAGQSNASGTSVTALDAASQVPIDQTQCGVDGRYTLWVPPGTYHLRAFRQGFTAQQRDVTVSDINQPVTADFQLAP